MNYFLPKTLGYITITTDRKTYTTAMSSAHGIMLPPNLNLKRIYEIRISLDYYLLVSKEW